MPANRAEGAGGNAGASRASQEALGKETPASVREHSARATFLALSNQPSVSRQPAGYEEMFVE